MSSESMYRKGNDQCATPEWIKEGLFRGWYDPCPLTKGLVDQDGLYSEWPSDRVFINPPYSNPLPWIERAIKESQKGKTIALLLKHDSSTKWFASLHEAGGHFFAYIGRLQFVTAFGQRSGRKAAAPFPSILVILSLEQTKEDKP